LSDILLDVRGLHRTFGRVHAVEDLSFTMERGTLFGFIGPNGSGKTTTMRILATLDLPDQGDVFVEGISALVDPRGVRMRIGFMSDQFAPYPNLDVAEFLDFFARAYGLIGAERVRRVRAAAEFCGLLEFMDRPATGLSKGMGQRVHLAKTLLHDPALLVLDEPAAGLDPRARIEFRDLLKALCARGKGILISSHILSELGEMCDGALVIERGRKMAAGTLAEIARGVTDHGRVLVRVLRDGEAAERFFLTQPQVQDVLRDELRITFEFSGDDDERAALLGRAVAQGLAVVEFVTVEADLEEIFMKTTKGRLQ
jgi:ABC-2 type transport system ATP-binding protein